MVVVNDKYVPDCISYQTLLKVNQSSYRIKGDDVVEKPAQQDNTNMKAPSQQLKPEKRLKIPEVEQTPSRSSQSQISAHPSGKEDKSLFEDANQSDNDANLARAIEEAKAMEYLV